MFYYHISYIINKGAKSNKHKESVHSRFFNHLFVYKTNKQKNKQRKQAKNTGYIFLAHL